MKTLPLPMLAVAMFWLSAGLPVRADVFMLATGGKVEGELLNPDEKPRQTYVVELPAGGKVTLEASQVQKVVAVRADQQQYEKIRHRYPDTVEGQWALAEWCRQQRLLAERDTHLERIVELDPNHAEARRLLGYTQIDGQWMKQDEVMIKRGYVRYKGRWRTKQEIDLLENKRKQELVEKEWCQKVDRWRGWLTNDRAEAARQNILAIDDPAAVKALALGLRNDKLQPTRLLCIEALAKIGTHDALMTLASTAIEDQVEEVRLTCLDYLQKTKNPDVVAYFVSQLRSKENRTLNLAAIGLSRMKDPSAIGPLIDALVTSHKQKISQANPNQTSASFGSGPNGGGSGLAMGGGPRFITLQATNQPVLDALVTLSGQNFSFDQRAWKAWFALQKRSDMGEIDTRRN